MNRKEYYKQWYQLNKEKISEQKKQYRQLNREKISEYKKQWYQLNREKILEQQKQWYQLNREKIIKYYSNGTMTCECPGCTENQIEFLCIDHINNNGAEHRKEIGGRTTMYLWLIKNNFPSGFRVLCFNCNCARRHGDCPHTKLITCITGVASA